jgi:hypothetical protein
MNAIALHPNPLPYEEREKQRGKVVLFYMEI